MKSIIISLILTITSVFSYAQCDQIIFASGTEAAVIVIEISDKQIKYKKCSFNSGPVYVIDKNDVFMVIYSNDEHEVFANTQAAKPEEGKRIRSDKTTREAPFKVRKNAISSVATYNFALSGTKLGYGLSFEKMISKRKSLRISASIMGSESYYRSRNDQYWSESKSYKGLDLSLKYYFNKHDHEMHGFSVDVSFGVLAVDWKESYSEYGGIYSVSEEVDPDFNVAINPSISVGYRFSFLKEGFLFVEPIFSVGYLHGNLSGRSRIEEWSFYDGTDIDYSYKSGWVDLPYINIGLSAGIKF